MHVILLSDYVRGWVCACVPYFYAVRFMDLFAQCIVLVHMCA